MEKFLFICLIAIFTSPLVAQKATTDKKIVQITSEADLKNYENSLHSDTKTKSQATQKKQLTPSVSTPENEYSEEELQQILEWYGQYAEENPTAFRSKNPTNPQKSEKK